MYLTILIWFKINKTRWMQMYPNSSEGWEAKYIKYKTLNGQFNLIYPTHNKGS